MKTTEAIIAFHFLSRPFIRRALDDFTLGERAMEVDIDHLPATSRRAFLAVIRSAFNEINSDFRIEIEQKIPVPGSPDVLVSYEELPAHDEMGEPEVVIPKRADVAARPRLSRGRPAGLDQYRPEDCRYSSTSIRKPTRRSQRRMPNSGGRCSNSGTSFPEKACDSPATEKPSFKSSSETT